MAVICQSVRHSPLFFFVHKNHFFVRKNQSCRLFFSLATSQAQSYVFCRSAAINADTFSQTHLRFSFCSIPVQMFQCSQPQNYRPVKFYMRVNLCTESDYALIVFPYKSRLVLLYVCAEPLNRGVTDVALFYSVVI